MRGIRPPLPSVPCPDTRNESASAAAWPRPPPPTPPSAPPASRNPTARPSSPSPRPPPNPGVGPSPRPTPSPTREAAGITATNPCPPQPHPAVARFRVRRGATCRPPTTATVTRRATHQSMTIPPSAKAACTTLRVRRVSVSTCMSPLSSCVNRARTVGMAATGGGCRLRKPTRMTSTPIPCGRPVGSRTVDARGRGGTVGCPNVSTARGGIQVGAAYSRWRWWA